MALSQLNGICHNRNIGTATVGFVFKGASSKVIILIPDKLLNLFLTKCVDDVDMHFTIPGNFTHQVVKG